MRLTTGVPGEFCTSADNEICCEGGPELALFQLWGFPLPQRSPPKVQLSRFGILRRKAIICSLSDSIPFELRGSTRNNALRMDL
jgi:hypothetical protein